MITVEHLHKSFKTGDSMVEAVRDVSFEVADGSFTAIIGKSGSGKSTLLGLLGGLDAVTSGSIVINGHDITTLHDRGLTRYRGKNVGFVFQSFNLIPNLNALENVMLPMEFSGVQYEKRRKRAQQLLHLVGLSTSEQKRHPNKLSGGQQQRVAIARALANHPRIILADEPTGNLDSETGKQIIALLKQIGQKEQVTIVLVTHDMQLARQCDTILALKDGSLDHTRIG